ncbi:MAG: N-acetyl-gamma-glutamyl-phosphate reductase [Acidiferrobacterales bacterium]|nr:N-acetyl-gamma-glutamyl-phosphate reductase [Acidiferrobacterales bacterium]
MTSTKTPAVYIDGQAGTTALKIHEILADRDDIEVISLPDADRKNPASRKNAIDQSDLSILCLPDDAARQAAQWAAASNTQIIDASTAHRVTEGWVYGLPEISDEFRQRIRKSDRVANPGCYPTSVILLMRPLIDREIVSADCPIVVNALSGYTGGGRKMIERWESEQFALHSMRYAAPYALERVHKHIPEMIRYSGLRVEPQFLPRVGPFAQGMRVEIPLHRSWLDGADSSAEKVWETLEKAYRNERFVNLKPLYTDPVDEFEFDPRACNDTNRIDLSVSAHPSGHVLLTGILDNLGKGASGAAVQAMNLMFGFEEDTGLAT